MEKAKAIEILWNYLKMNHTMTKVDLIVVFGCHDLQVAHRGSELFLEKLAPKILFTGGLGRITSSLWDTTEADKFAEIALEKGISANHILIENKSSNTGENIEYSKKLLETKKITVKNIIAVHKPYMERRTYAAIRKKWSDVNVIVTSPQKSFFEYCDYLEKYDTDPDTVINIMVGDLQRMDIYYKKGFQIYQEIPDNVWKAYYYLVKLGYTKQVIITS